jgi:RHS repeat-associated protein
LLLASSAAHAATTVTTYTYDAGDQLISETDPRGLVTNYTYDGLGQLWQQSSPDTGVTTYSYDSNGRRTSMTRASGIQTTYTYDAVGRRTSISAGGQTQNFSYDTCTNGIGRLCSAADSGGSVGYSYTPQGWVSGRAFVVSGTQYAVGYSYNAMGQMTATVYPDGNQALYSYTNGVVSSVSLSVGGVSINGANNITYQPQDLGMNGWTSSNGLATTLSYDNDGRLIGINVPGVQSLGLQYDTADRITQLTNGMTSGLTQNFGYDDQSQLVSVYSGLDNENFQYDPNGNRIAQTVNGNSLTAVYGNASNQLANTGAASYGYDAQGNLTVVNGTVQYQYNSFNRLVNAGGSTYYVDPEGQRLMKSVKGAVSYFAPSVSNDLLAESNGGSWTDYVWLNGRLVGRINAGQVQTIHVDQVGRPEVVTDVNQAVVWRAQNLAFTRSVVQSSGVILNIGLPGQYYDAESGTWNNGYRDYSDVLGRYIESDPVGLLAGVNTYVYVGGNPLMYTDPYGLDWQLSYQLIGGSVILPGGGGSANVAIGINFPSLNPLTWSGYVSGQAAGGIGGGVYGGYGAGINISHGDAPTTGLSQSHYAEADGGWDVSGGVNASWDDCGKVTSAQGGLGVKWGVGYGAGGFIGTSWSATAVSPTLGSMLGL